MREKFAQNWFGPYQVRNQADFDTYQLADPSGRLLKALVHRDRLQSARVPPNFNPTRLWNRHQPTPAVLRVLEGYDEADLHDAP